MRFRSPGRGGDVCGCLSHVVRSREGRRRSYKPWESSTRSQHRRLWTSLAFFPSPLLASPMPNPMDGCTCSSCRRSLRRRRIGRRTRLTLPSSQPPTANGPSHSQQTNETVVAGAGAAGWQLSIEGRDAEGPSAHYIRMEEG